MFLWKIYYHITIIVYYPAIFFFSGICANTKISLITAYCLMISTYSMYSSSSITNIFPFIFFDYWPTHLIQPNCGLIRIWVVSSKLQKTKPAISAEHRRWKCYLQVDQWAHLPTSPWISFLNVRKLLQRKWLSILAIVMDFKWQPCIFMPTSGCLVQA